MLTIYILIWPLISAVILFIIVRAFLQDVKKAKENNNTIV